MLSKLELLKIDLLANGMKVSERAKNELSRDGQLPLSLFEYATTSGIPLRFSGTDIFVNAPFAEDFCKTANQILDYNGENYLIKDYIKSQNVEPIPLPAYFDKKNKNGQLYSWFAMTHTDRVRISPIAGCSYSCQFCDSSRTFKYQKKSLPDLLDSIRVAINDSALPAKHVLISGGTPKPEDWSYMDKVYRETAKAFDIPIDVMMVPRPDLDYVNKIHGWGINELSINLEVYNQEIARKIIIEKNIVGRDHYFKFLERAVEVFGKNRVRSILLVGLEPLESTLKGIESLAKLGVSPVLSPFRPSPKTPFIHLSPPTTQQLIEVYEKSKKITEKYDVKLGPSCIPCHHNTLTFPDGSKFYKYS